MGLHTSWEKTKLQNIGYGPPTQPVSVDGHPVEVTDKFRGVYTIYTMEQMLHGKSKGGSFLQPFFKNLGGS